MGVRVSSKSKYKWIVEFYLWIVDDSFHLRQTKYVIKVRDGFESLNYVSDVSQT